ncbi:hypothetical protein BDD12DRAFT_802077 [Trichophaea hybrida]|nr:hypothetical protein BDD12DRAFT_802077 [Trichophaea hybrida]
MAGPSRHVKYRLIPWTAIRSPVELRAGLWEPSCELRGCCHMFPGCSVIAVGCGGNMEMAIASGYQCLPMYNYIVHNREYNPSSQSRLEDNSPITVLGWGVYNPLVARSKETYDFYYMKNRPCSNSEKDYGKELLATLSNDNIGFKEKIM